MVLARHPVLRSAVRWLYCRPHDGSTSKYTGRWCEAATGFQQSLECFVQLKAKLQGAVLGPLHDELGWVPLVESLSENFWIPAFAAMTLFGEASNSYDVIPAHSKITEAAAHRQARMW